MTEGQSAMGGAVYVQTNEAEANRVAAFRRAGDGTLSPLGSYVTGGRGTGEPHLPSQNSLVLSQDGRWLVVANAGSDDVSLLVVLPDGLALSDRASSGGNSPTSVAVHGTLVYALNRGGDGAAGNVSGLTIGEGGKLLPLEGSTRGLSSEEADPAQVAFSPDGKTLAVTERVTDRISAYEVTAGGYLDGPIVHASSGATPYGFDFTRSGTVVVTEAFGGQVGAAAASSYAISGMARLVPVSASIGNTRSEVCWAVVGKDGRFAYVTNFCDGTISSYAIHPDGSIELVGPVVAATRLGEKGIRDAALSRDGRFLYAIDADSQEIYGWEVRSDGSLTPLGAVDGLPATVAGLAAN